MDVWLNSLLGLEAVFSIQVKMAKKKVTELQSTYMHEQIEIECPDCSDFEADVAGQPGFSSSIC